MPHASDSLQTYAQSYLPRFQASQELFLDRLQTLVDIDSGTGQIGGVNQIMQYLEDWLTRLGFTVTLHPTEPYGNNLVARLSGTGEARVLLVGHVDTVYPAGSAQLHPFTMRDGVAYGPGVIDMKSGVVMCVDVLAALLESGFSDFAELCVVFNNDEEVGSLGSAPLLREVARQVDIGLVLESARAAEVLTHARKGADKYVLEVRGVSAHSGAEPHKGRSAVIELAHKMLAIHNLNTLYHGVTFNVTRLSSTEPLNIVPDLARCHISVRSHTQQGLDKAATALAQIAESVSMPDTHATLKRAPGRRPYTATPEVLALLKLAQIEGEALGVKITPEAKGGVSDANLLMEVGTPALDSLGPIGGGMHNLSREYLFLDSIPQRSALLAGLIRQICLSKFTG